MNTRRHFLKCCSTAVLGGGALPALGAILPRTLSGTMPMDFTAFSGLLNHGFELIPETGPAIKVLLSKAELYQPSHRPEAVSEENFNLHFTAAAGTPLEEGTYAFRHAVRGEMQLFVVPQKNTEGGTDYVATFHGNAVNA